MFRIITNKLVRKHKLYLYVVIILAIFIFIHSNFINSQQMISINLLENRQHMLQVHSLFHTSNSSKEQNQFGIHHHFLETTTAASVEATDQSGVGISPQNMTVNLTTTAPNTSGQAIWKGHVNSLLWRSMCIVDVPSLVEHPLFPLWPSARGHPKMPDELESIAEELWAVQRVLGYLYPPVSGKYRFKIYSDTFSEFWLSTDRSPSNSSLLTRNNRIIVYSIEFTKGPLILTSKPVYLKHGKAYYFEILHGINSAGGKRVRVRWMLPREKTYTGIPKTAVSTIIEEGKDFDDKTKELLTSSASLFYKEPKVKKSKVYEWNNAAFAKTFKPYSSYTKDNLHTVKFANRWRILQAFNQCDYSPSYMVKRHYKRFQGVYFTHYTDVFPDDDTGDKWWFESSIVKDMVGNSVVTEKEAIFIVKMFMEKLEKMFPGEYSLANVINLERNIDKERGNRYLLEILLMNNKLNQLQRLSEYVLQLKKNPGELCKPKGLKWSRKVKVNVILTTKNQGPWVVFYIKNMAEIVHATQDANVHFIVVDYGNNGVNVAEEFKRNNINSYTIIQKDGKFHKTLAIAEAANAVRDDNSIVFLTDLHISAPHNIFESVRKHTVQGRMAFTPVVFRLSKCSRPDGYVNRSTSSGFWEGFGYGLFSTYKSDWKTFGGVNIKEFQHKWGGEDWEMVDRVLAKGIEIERLRLPNFYHYYHDKSGMWHKA